MEEYKGLSEGCKEIFAYFTCDKADCKKQNTRKIVIYDRSIKNDYCPIINVDDICDYCGMSIHEPIFIEVTSFWPGPDKKI